MKPKRAPRLSGERVLAEASPIVVNPGEALDEEEIDWTQEPIDIREKALRRAFIQAFVDEQKQMCLDAYSLEPLNEVGEHIIAATIFVRLAMFAGANPPSDLAAAIEFWSGESHLKRAATDKTRNRRLLDAARRNRLGSVAG